MRRTAWLALGIAALIGISAAFAPARQSGDVTKVLPGAEKVKKSRKRVKTASIAKIEKALGRKMTKSRPVIYECRYAVPALGGFEKVRVLVVFIEIKGPKGTIKLGIASVPEDRVVAGVGIIKNNDSKIIGKPAFLEQFGGFEYGDSLYNSPDELAEARKKSKGSSDSSKNIAVMLELNRRMRQNVQRLWDEALKKIEDEDKLGGKTIRDLIKELEGITKMASKVPFMSGTRQGRFNRWMRGQTRAMKPLADAISAGKFNEAYKRAGEITKAYCSRCHAGNQRFWEQNRLKEGIGNGYFEIGLDVTNPSPKEAELIEKVLSAIREGVLILNEAK